MAPLDLTMDLPDLAGDAPAGPNLELDAEFGALERAAQGTPERQAGDKILPAEDPIWKDVAAQADALLDRTYDLRVLTHLAIARLHLTGLADFVAVLATIAGLLDTRWEHVHPQLEAEDGNDPTFRANALLQLAHPIRVLRVLRTMPLASSQRAGRVSWRVIAAALGTIEPAEGEPRQTESEIRAAFADTAGAKVDEIRENIATAQRAIAGIGASFDSHCGYGNAPDLGGLTKLFQEIDRYIGLYYVPGATAEGDEVAPPADEGDEHPAPTTSQAVVRGGGAVTAMNLTAVKTRAEALHLLDLACRYYEQNEPSSPLPLLIGRARRLADKSFLEILQDLAPDGLGQAQNIVQSREG